MSHHGFVRVASAAPLVRVADCDFNAARTSALLRQAEEQGVAVLVCPELGLTGYTCADLFHQTSLQRSALAALEHVTKATSGFGGVVVVGLPLVVDDQLFNCAAVLHRGRVLGVIPKSYLPNYKEFYERRWFSPAANARSRQITLLGQSAFFGTDLLFQAENVDGLIVGVEICEDLWVPIPPSSLQAMSGATVLLNLSASNDLIGKSNYRRQLVVNQSGRCIAAYVYSSCGVGESTTDVVFAGHCLIAENSTLLSESQRFERDDVLVVTDVDMDRLRMDRLRMNSYGDGHVETGLRREFRRIPFTLVRKPAPPRLLREVEARPFVPRGQEQLRERCEEIFHIQIAGLAKRLEHIGKPPVSIGVSGGLDSTLALLVTCKTFDALQAPRNRIRAFTMPGFGTTTRTLGNARALMKELGVTASEVDIRSLCLEEMRVLGHRPFGIDLASLSVSDFQGRLQQAGLEGKQDVVFENVQARMRMSILMNAAFVIGTGDVSELALGWCTYNGDHMNMYNPNVSIPKTLVKFLIQWVAMNEFAGEARRVLLDIFGTEISPELLPAGQEGKIVQQTERVIGPYELHDFFLFHFLRYGAPPEKILYLVEHAQFEREYARDEVCKWLRVFLQRFFANQFKRSCLPDGPKVGSISLSPRGDWRMPSDAVAAQWLAALDTQA